MENIAVIILIGIIGLLIVLFFVFVPVGLWISSLAANVKISIFNLIGMRLRRVVPSRIVLPLIKARKAGMKLLSSPGRKRNRDAGFRPASVRAACSTRACSNGMVELLSRLARTN